MEYEVCFYLALGAIKQCSAISCFRARTLLSASRDLVLPVTGDNRRMSALGNFRQIYVPNAAENSRVWSLLSCTLCSWSILRTTALTARLCSKLIMDLAERPHRCLGLKSGDIRNKACRFILCNGIGVPVL